MAPATLSVHACRAHMSIFTSFLNEIYHVPVRIHWLFLQAFHIHSFFYILAYLEVDRGWLKEIHYLLIVDLKVAALY